MPMTLPSPMLERPDEMVELLVVAVWAITVRLGSVLLVLTVGEIAAVTVVDPL